MNKKIIKIGIIGGLGPLASASFVESIYASYLQTERLKALYHTPYVYLYSEPLLSQTTSIMSLQQSESELLLKLEHNIAHLFQLGVDHIVICCFTAHALLPKLLPEYQIKISSLVQYTLEYVLKHPTPCMVLSAPSARAAQVFENHPLGKEAASQFVYLDMEGQERLNTVIKAVKEDQVTTQVVADFLKLVNNYPNRTYLIACAELHVLHKKLRSLKGQKILPLFDPFYEVIQSMWGI